MQWRVVLILLMVLGCRVCSLAQSSGSSLAEIKAAALTQAFPTPRTAGSYILDTVPIVKRKDEAKWGDYRTQRVILEIYDALTEAMQTGMPYRSRLDPPPADPKRCHPPKESGSI